MCMQASLRHIHKVFEYAGFSFNSSKKDFNQGKELLYKIVHSVRLGGQRTSRKATHTDISCVAFLACFDPCGTLYHRPIRTLIEHSLASLRFMDPLCVFYRRLPFP